MSEPRVVPSKPAVLFAAALALVWIMAFSPPETVGSEAPADAPAVADAAALAPPRAVPPSVAIPAPVQAEEEMVLAAVQAFFDGLGTSVEALRATRLDEGSVTRMRERDGVLDWSIQTFAEMDAALAQNDARMLERMWDATVLVHGPLAQVWTPYDFYVNGEFSHCGVDSFTLIKAADGWMVSSVAYTVEMTGCEPSPLGPPRR